MDRMRGGNGRAEGSGSGERIKVRCERRERIARRQLTRPSLMSTITGEGREGGECGRRVREGGGGKGGGG
jgi:hypothetical protein